MLDIPQIKKDIIAGISLILDGLGDKHNINIDCDINYIKICKRNTTKESSKREIIELFKTLKMSTED